MIPLDLLKLTEGRALGILPYGIAGTKKSLAIHTLPPPILMIDFEGGAVPLLPWIRSRVRWDGTGKVDYTDADRAAAFAKLSKENMESFMQVYRINPAPYIDVVWYDPQEYQSYTGLVQRIGNFEKDRYNSLAIDSLQEFSADVYTYSKGPNGAMSTMQETGAWSGGQERARMLLRQMRSLRDSGIFIYMTSSENIDKDYITDPRSQKPGQQEQPYSIKGTVNLSGQLVPFVQHVTDLMLHARPIGKEIVWVSKSEPIGAGSAMWEAKDRTGRLKGQEGKHDPNIRKLLDDIYGEELRKEIYKQR